MKTCPYCNYANYDNASVCRKCENSFIVEPGTVYHGKTYWLGPEKAKVIRRRALTLIVLGLLIKVYWGGYGPWPMIDSPTLITVRAVAEPLLLYGGAALYLLGWGAAFV